ncbi:MAG: substrate-binding periplasmic protein [Aestuariibacter sp.]
MTEHLKPFQVVEGDNISGVATDIVRLTMDQANVSYVIEVHDWHISYARAMKEPLTCIYSISRTKEREQDFHWIGQILQLPTALYSAANANLKLNSLDDARDYRTAVLKNDVSHLFLQRHGFVEGENYYVSQNFRSLFTLLDIPSRNIDLVMANDILLRNRFSNGYHKRYKKVLDLKQLTLYFYLACNLDMPGSLVERLRRAMMETQSRSAALRAAALDAS